MFEPVKIETPLFAEYARLEPGQLPMFIGVYLGLKPLMDTFVTLDIFNRLRQLCSPHGILVEHNHVMAVTPGEDFLRRHERIRRLGTTKLQAVPFDLSRQNALVHTFISRSPEMVEQARQLTWYNLFADNRQLTQPLIDNYRYGATLGFPDCCVKFYAAHNALIYDGRRCWGFNTPHQVYDNTRGEFSFLCNYVPMDHHYFLIHHYPCSYNCPETIKLAEKLLSGIKSMEPQFAQAIVETLKLPYLVFGEKRAFAFRGRIVKGNEIIYSHCRFLGDPRDQNDYREIQEGNRVTTEQGRVKVFRDDRELAGYPDEEPYRARICNFK